MNTKQLNEQMVAYDLSSCIIQYDNKIIYHYEKYKNASAQLMPINSCTKSVLSSLICMAMESKLLPHSQTLISEFFPILKQATDERKQRITLEHLLTLTPGFRWEEFGGINSFPKMTRSDHWIDYVLDQPMSDEPGAVMVYNSGASQLLAAILRQGISIPISTYAEQQLFDPLEINQYSWKTDPEGNHTGGYGMELNAYDLLKFGTLYLNMGAYQGRSILQANWVNVSTTPYIQSNPPEQGFYGWHWWVDRIKVKNSVTSTEEVIDFYYARGFGGQFIIIIPSLHSVVVMTRKPRKKGLFPLDLFKQCIASYLLTSIND